MSEREIKQLIKLLEKFRATGEKDDSGEVCCRDTRITNIISTMIQWVKWHGRDEMDMDL